MAALIANIPIPEGSIADKDVFIKNLPDSLEDLYHQVPKKEIKAYRANIISSWQSLIKEYLL
mgnify:CR=1 FL=1